MIRNYSSPIQWVSIVMSLQYDIYHSSHLFCRRVDLSISSVRPGRRVANHLNHPLLGLFLGHLELLGQHVKVHTTINCAVHLTYHNTRLVHKLVCCHFIIEGMNTEYCSMNTPHVRYIGSACVACFRWKSNTQVCQISTSNVMSYYHK